MSQMSWCSPQHQAVTPQLLLGQEEPLSARVSVLRVQNKRDLLVLAARASPHPGQAG